MQDRNWGLRALVEGIGEGFDSRQERFSKLAKAKDDEESLAFERELGKQNNVPDFIFEIKDSKQRQFWLKHYLKPKSLGEHVSEFAGKLFGNGQSQNQFQGNTKQSEVPTIIRGANNQPLAVQIGSQIVNADEISPETLQSIEMLEQQNAQADQQDSTFGTKAGNILTGLGTRYAGLKSGGDITAAGVTGVHALGNLAGTEEGRESERQKWAERIKGLSPQEISSLASEGSFNQLANPEEVRESARNLLPTTETIQKGIEKVTKGTPVEKYVASKNESDLLNKDIGEVIALISRPGETLGETALNMVKGAGAVVSSKLAGWLTEKATGSERTGKFTENAGYVLYSLFPGLPSTLYNKAYDQFRDKVINPAVAQGKTVNLTKYKPELNKIKKDISDTFSKGSLARQQLDAEANKIEKFVEKTPSSIAREATKHPGEKLLNTIKNEKKLNTLLKGEQLSTQELGQIKDFIKKVPKESAKAKESFEKINPLQLWENAKKMGQSSYRNGLDKQAVDSGLYQKLIDLQKKAVTDFGNKFSPHGGELLEKADNFYKVSKDIQSSIDAVKDNISVRNLGVGSAIYMMSNFPTVLKVGAAYAVSKFFTHMLKSPAVRSEITELLKAGATQNTVLINKAMNRFNSQTDSQLSKLPAEDQRKIREFAKTVNSEVAKGKSK
jgi:hypothetical protein